MNATQVRRHASSYGFKLILDPEGKLHARGNGSAMTPELKKLIEAHKPAIIDSLKSAEKAERDSNIDVNKWFWGFASAKTGGYREHEGEIVDVWQRCQELQDIAVNMALMPRLTAADETAFRRAEDAWFVKVREFRDIFEMGELWKENKG